MDTDTQLVLEALSQALEDAQEDAPITFDITGLERSKPSIGVDLWEDGEIIRQGYFDIQVKWIGPRSDAA